MIDVKKFVGAFLVIAALASASAFLTIGFGGNTGSVANITPSGGAPAQSSFSLGDNAFAAQSPAGQQGETLQAAMDDPNNLTNKFANVFINGVVSANPNGMQADASGTATFNAPDANTIFSNIAADPSIQNLQVPDWDLEAAKRVSRVSPDASSQSVSQYSDALNAITNKYFIKSGIQSVITQSNPGVGDVSLVGDQVHGALDDVTSLEAPGNLQDFHKSMLKLLVYQDNMLALAKNSATDPLKSALVFQAESSKYAAALQNFQAQSQRAFSVKGFRFGNIADRGTRNAFLAFAENLFGVPTAHAQWPVFDAINFGEWIQDFLKSFFLQLLKNSLVTLVQNNVLRLVQNSGAPRFLQNWANTMAGAFELKAISSINKAAPGLYPAFSGAALSNMTHYYQSDILYGTGYVTPLEQIVGPSLDEFYGDFSQGSWGAFAAASLPTGNFFGSQFALGGGVERSAENQKMSIEHQAVASNGFWPVSECGDHSVPNPADGNLCEDGKEPVALTPGQTVKQLLDSATGADVHLIVNADDVAGLAATIATTLLNKLTNGFTLVNAKVDVQTPPKQPPQPLSCVPPNQNITLTLANGNQAYPAFDAQGGAPDKNGLPPTYTWNAGSASGAVPSPTTGTGFNFNTVYTIFLPGSYSVTVTVTASTGGSATCHVQITAS